MALIVSNPLHTTYIKKKKLKIHKKFSNSSYSSVILPNNKNFLIVKLFSL